MLNFRNTSNGVELEYDGDAGTNNQWIWDELTKSGKVRVSKLFHFRLRDLLNPPKSTQNFNGYVYRFKFGEFDQEYVKVRGRIVGIENDLLLSCDMELKRTIFGAERNVSIFGRLSNVLDHADPIVIGGGRPGAIPRSVFEELLKKFPNSYEVDRYAEARVQTILSQYMDGMKDARARYESYLTKKMSGSSTPTLDLTALKKLEVEKYVLIRDLISDALKTKTDLSEGEWQQLMLSFLLLLFPKYIKVLENVTIHDYYSDPTKKTNRYIDIALVDANGNLDIIEVKKPFDDKIFRKSPYRGNSIPTSELSGSIMQPKNIYFTCRSGASKGSRISPTGTPPLCRRG